MEKSLLKTKDKVFVITGNDKGKIGVIEQFNRTLGKIRVEGVAKYKKHVKPSQGEKGRIVEMNRFIRVSNVMMYCEKCKKPVRLRCKISEKNKKNRECAKCAHVFS